MAYLPGGHEEGRDLPGTPTLAAVALLALGAGVVLAQDDPAAGGDRVVVQRGDVIQCRSVPCRGTGGHDLIYERKGNGK
jgi:hypothetical protein